MRRALVLTFILGFLLGFAYVKCQDNSYTGIFTLSVESGYNNAVDGIRFINLSHTGRLEPLTFAGDADLPLTQFLLRRDKKRVLITIEEVPERKVQTIAR